MADYSPRFPGDTEILSEVMADPDAFTRTDTFNVDHKIPSAGAKPSEIPKRIGRYVDENGNDVPEDQPDARKVPLTVTRYSDTMLIFLMKGRLSQKYGDRKRLEYSGRVDHEPVDMHIVDDLTEAKAVQLMALLSRISYTTPVPEQ